MLKSKLFRKYLLLGITICTLATLAGITSVRLMMKSQMNKGGPFALRVNNRIVSTLNGVPHSERIHEIESLLNRPMFRMRVKEIYLLDDKKNIIYPSSKKPGFSIQQLKEKDLIRLEGNPTQYLSIALKSFTPPPYMKQRMRKNMMRIVGIHLVSILLGVGLTLFIIYNHFRKRTAQIEQVIQNIHEGNLKSRMEVESDDEFGLTMKSFNLMADEIEQLVLKLKKTESTRRELLSELAHDIRTPIASIKSLLENFQENSKILTDNKKEEILNLSRDEVEYIATLVEDLLFLGEIEEPSYQISNTSFDLEQTFSEAADKLTSSYPKVSFTIKSSGNLVVLMNKNLVDRLARNILENSFSFATESVSIDICCNKQQLDIVVQDDGPGFSKEKLKTFGIKKFSRQEENVCGKKRITIGLGAVIIKRIAEIYNGKLTVSNNVNDLGEITGARVSVSLQM